ncbi:MAG: NAD(P)H-dependent oxidoreductase [Ruminococcus sp.]|nr:NAD(P)H-dependent oxidoreductase [Ruminococcus sp.]
MSVIAIYYSFGGNTRGIAEKIADELGAEIAEIRTVKPYMGSYNDVVEQGQREVNSGYLPKLKQMDIDLEKYDTLVLGTPVWWYTLAPAMSSFLSETDLKGKTIYPFATNGGWLGHTFEDFQRACRGAKVMEGGEYSL